MRMPRRETPSRYLEKNTPSEVFSQLTFLGERAAVRDKNRRKALRNVIWATLLMGLHVVLIQGENSLIAFLLVPFIAWNVASFFHHLGALRLNRRMVRGFEDTMPYFLLCLENDLGEIPPGADGVLMRSYPPSTPGSPRWSALQWLEKDRVLAAVEGKASSPLDPLLPFFKEDRGKDFVLSLGEMVESTKKGRESILSQPQGKKLMELGEESARAFMAVKFFAPRDSVAENTENSHTDEKTQNGE